MLGPKVMDWSDRDVILEAGLSIDTVGRRITGIEPREVDQGQHDGDRDTLAVGSPGMLIRRDVWDLVRGFDPSMGLFREDVDFCWRVHAAGFRVRVITDAVVFHAQAAARRRRSVSVGRRPQLLNRRNALLTLTGNLPLVPMLKSLAGNICVSFLRVLFFLVAKRVTAALDESAAVGSVLLHPLRLMRVRSMRARGRKAAYSRLRAEIPPGRSLRRVAEFVAAMFATEQQAAAGSHHATEDPDEVDDFLLTDSGIVQRILTNPGVLLFIGLAVVTVAAERSLLSAGTLGGGALLPAGGAASVWHQYLLGFHPTGVGSPSTSPAYLVILALLATLLTGKAWLAVDVILLGCVPIAGLTAYFAIRRVTASVAVRIWVAATYALIPVAAGAIAAGRVGTAAAFALIPLIGLLAGRMFSQPPRIARRAAWATGLVTAVAAAFVPLVWPIALLAGVVAAALLRGGRRQLINIGIAVVVPAVLLIPWTFQLAAHPSGLLLEAGVQQPGLASPHLATRSLMLLSPGGPGLPPFWVTAGLIIVALVALLASRRRLLVVSGWTVAVLGLLVAIPASRVSVRPAVSGPAITAWPGAALAITAAGLLLAAAAGSDGLRAAVSSGRTGTRRIAGGRGVAFVLLAVIGCSAPVAAAAFWVRHGVDGPVGAARGQLVPALVSDDAVSSAQVRTLILSRQGSGISYQLLRGTGLNLGDAELAPVPAAESALRTAVAALAAPGGGQAVDQAQALARFDIGFVLLRAPVDPTLARTLDAVTGLRPVSMTASFDLWRLATMPSRVSVLENSGAVVPVPSGPVNVSGAAAPAAGGTLLLAEPAGGWQATLNGHALTAVPSPAGSWAQAFRLPSGGGTLDISRSELGHELALILELLAALVVAALALPGVRSGAETATVEASVSAGRRGAAVEADELAGAGAGAGAGVGGDRYGEGGPAGDETMVGAAYGAGRAAHARGGEPAGGGRAGTGHRQADGGRFDDGRLDDERLDDDAADDDRVGAGQVNAGVANAGQAGGGRRGAARLGARPGKGRLPGRGLGRRSKQAGPDSAARPGNRRAQPAGAGGPDGPGGPGRLAAGAGLAAAGARADWDRGQGEDWDGSGVPDLPPGAAGPAPAGRSAAGDPPGGRMGPPAGVRSPTGAWPYPDDDDLDQAQSGRGLTGEQDPDMTAVGYGSGPYPVAGSHGGNSSREAPYGTPANDWAEEGQSRRGRLDAAQAGQADQDWPSQPAAPVPAGRSGRRGSGQHAGPGRRGSGDGARSGRRGESDGYAESGSRGDAGQHGGRWRRGRSGQNDGSGSRDGNSDYDASGPRGGTGEYDVPPARGTTGAYDGPGRRGGSDEYARPGPYAEPGPYEGEGQRGGPGGYDGPERRGGPDGYEGPGRRGSRAYDGPERRGGSGEYARPGAYADGSPYAESGPYAGPGRGGSGEYPRPGGTGPYDRPGSRGRTSDYEVPAPRGGPGPGERGQSSWPSTEDQAAWPAADQAGWASSDQTPSWPGGDQRPDWPAGASGAWRGGAPPPAAPPPSTRPPAAQRPARRPGPQPGGTGRSLDQPPGRSGYGNDPAYGHDPAYGNDPAHGGGGPDWTPDDSDADWPGSDESLEPLPSTQTHRGGGGPDDRSRRRWPAPDGDDGDGRNGW